MAMHYKQHLCNETVGLLNKDSITSLEISLCENAKLSRYKFGASRRKYCVRVCVLELKTADDLETRKFSSKLLTRF